MFEIGAQVKLKANMNGKIWQRKMHLKNLTKYPSTKISIGLKETKLKAI